MFVVLEGADGTGKTTLCGVLAEKLGARSYSTPPKKYTELRTSIDKNASEDEHYRFYRDGVYDASDEIETLMKNGCDVVCDRYWLTTYTYHRIMGAKVSKDDFQHITIPTLTVVLALNHEVQINRMIRRGMSVGDRRVLDKQREISIAFYEDAVDFNIPFILIDTQRFSPDACADITIKALKL
jgi:thymidylate kinase